MENKKMDILTPEFWNGAISKGMEEIEEMRNGWKKEENLEKQQKIDNRFWFHKQFLEFKIWMKQNRTKDKQQDARRGKLICCEQVFSVPMDRHHVNETDIVFVPTHIHRACYHLRGDNKLEGVLG